ncbi:MAG: response regulator [Sulfuricella sp.]|nr:response regulator [Sulfuricella sp.]
MLVVDDVDIHRSLLSAMLALLFPEATVDEAGDGREAQRKLRERRYDIVLSDWMMPNMDGVALATWLNASDAPPPFVLISAHDECERIAALFSSPGIDGYLIKPHDHTAMKEVVDSVLGAPAPHTA